MPVEQTIQDEGYSYFLAEAPELLQNIEQGLFELEEDFHIQKVHSLMRSAHNLKGAAASVGLETIKKVAHYLEDVFKALYNPEVNLDNSLLALLFEGYECLREPLMAEVTGNQINDGEILDRAASVFAACQEKLGDFMGDDAKIPTAAELGFDITKSIFETGVTQRLEELKGVLKNNPQPEEVADCLRGQSEVFIGLAESLNLPGFLAISEMVLAALNAHPEAAMKIGKVAFADWKKAREAVLAGDRSVGGEVSPNLQRLAAKPESKNGSKKVTENHQNGLPEKSPPLQKQEPEAVLKPEPESEELPDLDDIFGDTDEDVFNNLTDVVFLQHEEEIQPEDAIANSQDEDENAEISGFFPVALPSKFSASDVADAEGQKVDKKLESVNGNGVAKPKSDLEIERSPEKELAKTPAKNGEYKRKVAQQSVRVDLENLDSLNHLVGELLINQNRLSTRNEQLQIAVKELSARLKKFQKEEEEAPEKSSSLDSASLAPAMLPTSRARNQKKTKKLTLKEASNIIFQLVNESNETAVKQERLLLELRDNLMEVRMSPLAELFQRFPRLLQQTATSQEKPIEIKISGNEVLSDKSVWDKIYDPLLHLLRNSIAHGIESQEERRQRGKPEKGQISIDAFYQGTRLIIEVSDDGKGIDLDKIRRRGVELDIISVWQAENMPDSAVYDLIFEPGFSTALHVNDLAGRGVGLDVVRSQLESIKGAVSVRSQLLAGTTFSLQIPIPMTIAKLMVVQAGKAVYAIPSESIAQIIIPEPVQVKQSRGQRVLHLGDRFVPLHKLSDLMMYRTYNKNLKNTFTELNNFPLGKNEIRLGKNISMSISAHPVLLLGETGMIPGTKSGQEELAEKLWALEVDELFGEQELAIKTLGRAIAYPSYIYGSSILGDGSLMLVIDAVALINQTVEQLTVLTGSKQQVLPPADANKNVLPPEAKRQISGTRRREALASSSSQAEGQAEKNISQSRLLPEDAEKWKGQSIEVETMQIPLGAASCILVVDDSATLRKTISSTLTRAGYQVIQAGNGKEALEKLRQNRHIDLIISDVEMPEMDGFQFLDARRQDREIAQIPVVMLTACRSDKHQQLALALGATAYLTKPCSQPDLLATVSEKKLSAV